MGRTPPVVLFVAFLLAGGCAESSATRNAHYQARWDQLRTRMRPDQVPREIGATPQSPADESSTRALCFAADDVIASVVHVQTVIRRPAVRPGIGDAVRPASKRSGGTGVVIGPEGLILTNEHVVRDAADVCVVLSDGSRCAVEQVVVDDRLDLAVLRIDRSALRPLTLVHAPANYGNAIIAVGWSDPGGAACARTGVVTNASASLQNELDPTQRRRYDRLIESTARIEPGFSGGPLLDDKGRLIGLNVAVSGAVDGRRAYAIPCSARIQQVVADLAGRLLHD